MSFARTDYSKLKPAAYAQWVDSMVKANEDPKGYRFGPTGHWLPRSEDERLLTAIVRDLSVRNPGNELDGIILLFGESKRRLVSWDSYFVGLTVSRYGLSDWRAVLDATLQAIAFRISGEKPGSARWLKAVAELGASPAPVEFHFREPVGSATVLKTPYGDLPVSFGRTVLSTVDGSQSGVAVSASRTHIDLEDGLGAVRRLRTEELHPDSGRLERVIPVTKTVGTVYTVNFGKSSVIRGGKTFYALEHLSGRRVSVLAADGEKLVVEVEKLTL